MRITNVFRLFLFFFFALCSVCAFSKNINFSDNQTISVGLSNTNVNRIVVNHDKISNVICPTEDCSSKHSANDTTGDAYIAVLTQTPFTLFLSTINGHHVSLTVNPVASSGKTLVLNPRDSNVKAKNWEKESSYRLMLIKLVKNMMNNTVPNGYGFTPVLHADKEKVFHGKGVMRIQAIWSGNYLIGISYVFTNTSKKAMYLPEKSFYQKGIRLIVATEKYVPSMESEMVYEILSRN